MSQDRLPTRPILLVAHGDRAATNRNHAIAALARALGQALPDTRVGFGVLNGEPMLGCAVMALGLAPGERPLVVPLFMSDGYFTRVKLPAELAKCRLEAAPILPAMGLDPRIGDLILARLKAGLGHRGTDASILICAHGSRSGVPDSRLAAEAMAARLRAEGWSRVACAYVEEAPSIRDGLDAAQPDAVIGLFASLGTHALNDVSALVADQPQIRLFIPAIGADPGMVDVVAALIGRAPGQ